jgi:hypothetical protein
MWVDANEENSGIMRDFVPYHPTKNNIREPRARSLVKGWSKKTRREQPPIRARETAAGRAEVKKSLRSG